MALLTGIEKAKKDENGEEMKPWTREHIETALKRLMAQTFNEMTAVRPRRYRWLDLQWQQ